MQVGELIHELVEVGSIEGLIDRHEELTREEIESSLEEAACLIEGESQGSMPLLSPVYRAYNGLMLGLFVGASLAFLARNEDDKRERVMRRISEFLLELGSEFGQGVDFGGEEEIEGAIDVFVRDLDSELANYYQLGLAAFRCSIARVVNEDPSAAIEEVQDLLHTLGQPPVLFRELLEVSSPFSAESEPRSEWRDLMTGSLQLARRLLLGLQAEPETCFVALPFEAPYEDRYLNFYRLIGRTLEKRSIRAWGSISGEDHQELLMVLISRCGVLLADVTEPNANVTLEVGFALGRNTRTYLVAEGENWRSTANIQLDWVCPYDVREDSWEEQAAFGAGMFFQALDASRRPGPIPSWSAKPMALLSQVAEVVDKIGDGR